MTNATDSAIGGLNSATKAINKLLNKLASGKRVLSASDDPSGLAVISHLESKIATQGVAVRNNADGNSALEIANGALSQISGIGTRLAELSAQSANGTLSDTDRNALDQEFQQLKAEAVRIADTTEFNGVKLLQGGGQALQTGTTGGSDSLTTTTLPDANALIAGQLGSASVSNQGSARQALDSVNSFISQISQAQGSIGAVQSRLSIQSEGAQAERVANITAKSRIEDFDIAEGLAEKTSLEIRQKGAASLLAISNRLNGELVKRLTG